MKARKGTVFVGLSGGVDSAVSAAVLQRDGYDVVGVFIRIALPGYPCPAAQDRRDAMRVAAHLRIPFHEIDLSEHYVTSVFSQTLKEFTHGNTPNPDTLCNREIKFGAFYRYARDKGADWVATGHYARAHRSHGRTQLQTGVDSTKDQSYFLWMVPEEALEYTLFPVGGMEKTNVRRLARTYGLPNAARKDSQGLCFLGPVSLKDMLTQELHTTPGPVLSEAGEVLGEHRGAALYTLGERHGFVLKRQGPHAQPHYIIAKDIERNTLTVSTNRFPQHATKTAIALRDTNWIGERHVGGAMARFRYRQPLIPAVCTTEHSVVLNEPHYVPEGQSLVLYHGTRCLGGGVVDKSDLLV